MFFSKQDLTTGEELEGATITVTEKETGKIIDEWVSTKEPHSIKYLIEGKEYVMTEKLSPKGYDYAESITFKAEDGLKITMKDKPKPVQPATGNKTNVIPYMLGAVLSLGAVIGIIYLKKKQEKE